MSLYYISLPYATFGIVANKYGIIKTAPIASWTKHKTLDYVLDYYRRKKAKIIKVRRTN